MMIMSARRRRIVAKMTSSPRLLIASIVVASGLWASLSHAYTHRHIFVANRGGNNVLELDDNLQLVRAWFDGAGIRVPNGMAFTPKGEVFVADTGNNRILGFDDAGKQTVSFDVTPYSLASIESLNFDANGVLYASANPGSGKVLRFDQSGNLLSYLVDDPLYVNLGNVNFTKDGNIVISDFSGQGRGIREVDTSGNLLRTFGKKAGLFYEDMLVDGADRIFASRLSENDVAVFDANRKLERTISAPGLSKPTGIVLTWDCRLIVASYGSDELYEFRHDGTFVRKVSVAGMSLPESLAIAGQRLTGSFGPDSGNTMEPTPSCDGAMADGRLDAGVVLDVGSPTADSGSSSSDSGATPPTNLGDGGGGCDCRLASAPSVVSFALLCLYFLVRRTRR
jgi:hypothetical protein